MINSFRDEYAFLSNFYTCPIVYKGLLFTNAEAAFQSAKVYSKDDKVKFTKMSPSQAKKAGKQVALRSDWEQIKDSVMFNVVYAKFSQNYQLKELLLATKNRVLVEGNDWHDTYWGVDDKTGQGLNKLGETLMSVRKKLLEEKMDECF